MKAALRQPSNSHSPVFSIRDLPFYLLLCGVTIGTICCFVSTGFSVVAVDTINQPPEQAVRMFLKTVGSLEFPITDSARHAELVRHANTYLDVEAMGSAALTDHWAGVSGEEKKVFLDLLWKLVETVAYPKNQNLMGSEQIVYGETVEAGDGFQVPVTLTPEVEAPAASMSYHLSEKEGRWKIDDVVLDDVSIIEDLKYQFNKIIADSEFSGLLEKMRRRLTEAEGKNKSEKA